MTIFGREPVMWLAAIQAILACAIGFGLNWTTEQMALVLAMTGAVLGLIARSAVTPQAPANVNDVRNYIEKAPVGVLESAGVKVVATAKTIALLFGLILASTAFVTEAIADTPPPDTLPFEVDAPPLLSFERFDAGPRVGVQVYDFDSALPREIGFIAGAVATYGLTSRVGWGAAAERKFNVGVNVEPHWRYSTGPHVLLPNSTTRQQWHLALERAWYASHGESSSGSWVVRLQWSFGMQDGNGRDKVFAVARGRYDVDNEFKDFGAVVQAPLISGD